MTPRFRKACVCLTELVTQSLKLFCKRKSQSYIEDNCRFLSCNCRNSIYWKKGFEIIRIRYYVDFYLIFIVISSRPDTNFFLFRVSRHLAYLRNPITKMIVKSKNKQQIPVFINTTM